MKCTFINRLSQLQTDERHLLSATPLDTEDSTRTSPCHHTIELEATIQLKKSSAELYTYMAMRVRVSESLLVLEFSTLNTFNIATCNIATA